MPEWHALEGCHDATCAIIAERNLLSIIKAATGTELRFGAGMVAHPERPIPNPANRHYYAYGETAN
jgi:hypothetical protein